MVMLCITHDHMRRYQRWAGKLSLTHEAEPGAEDPKDFARNPREQHRIGWTSYRGAMWRLT